MRTRGFGGLVVTGAGADDSGSPGTYGWDGGLGTSFRVDPQRQVVTILLTQRSWTSPVCRGFGGVVHRDDPASLSRVTD